MARPRNEILLYIGVALILFAPFNVNILGYDSLSIFILSLTFSLSVLYLQKANIYLLVLLAFICSLAVLIRLPNILVVPIVFLVIGFSSKRQKGNFSGKLPGMFFLLTLLFIISCYSMYYANFEEFYGASANSASHDLKLLFNNYFLHGLKLLLIIFLILGGYYIFKKVGDKKPKFIVYAGAGLFFIILVGLFVIRSKYSQNYSLFLTSLALSILIVLIFRNRKELLTIQNLVLYLYVLFLFINPFGSNTGLLKATSLFLLLPFILSFRKFKPEPYWMLIFFILLPFSLIEKLTMTYEDKGVLALDTTLKISLLNPIRTTGTRAAFLENIDAEIKELKKNNVQVYFYGNKSHVFHYLYPETSMNIDFFFQPVDDIIYYSQLEKKLEGSERVAIFIIQSYPGNETGMQHILGEELLKDGFKKIKTESYDYYLRNSILN